MDPEGVEELAKKFDVSIETMTAILDRQEEAEILAEETSATLGKASWAGAWIDYDDGGTVHIAVKGRAAVQRLNVGKPPTGSKSTPSIEALKTSYAPKNSSGPASASKSAHRCSQSRHKNGARSSRKIDSTATASGGQKSTYRQTRLSSF
ncbi:MAG: hypothetical protein H6512_14395 [Acidimicrobiia bacterium]|nr:hypothetical protein [Acidimicrobiia bacterium]